LATACSHAESRLTCIECSKPICSQCMVQCPVGFRCKTCVGSANKSQGPSLRMVSIKTFAICAAMGFGAAWLMPFIGLPYISCFIWFFIGVYAGQHLAKIIDYRLRGSAIRIIILGILLGMSLSPIGVQLTGVFLEAVASLASGGSDFFGALLNIAFFLWVPIAFVAGVLRSAA
jgi:hypothetical protein